jgi:Allene oxide cyclase barrel like domain
MRRKRFVVAGAVVATLATTMVGLAVAQTGSGAGAARTVGDTLHVVLPATGAHVEFLDFAGDGLTLGDRLAAVGPIMNADQSVRVGTSYLDCWVGDARLEDGSPYVCTNVLKFRDGNITTEGLDPHGLSDVFFAITGGTGAYEGASGQAEYTDSESQTDITIELDG